MAPPIVAETDPPFWTKTSLLQLGYGVWVNLTVLGTGLTFGFSAVAVPQLLGADSRIMVAVKEEALITSILTLSAPIGCIVCGILLDRCGRKLGLILCHLLFALGWIYMGFARTSTDIIIGRVITGIGLGMAMIAPRAYITEITLPNMRGVLGALPNLTYSTGLALQAVLGAFLKWYHLCFIAGVYSVILLSANSFLPETPYYILLKSTATEASKVLKKFRSSSYDLRNEMKELKEFKHANDIRSLSPLETLKVLFSIQTCKPFNIVLFYVVLTQLVGVNVFVMWAVDMLTLSRSSIDPKIGNIAVACTRIVIGAITSFLLYKVGRRVMALISAIGVGMVSVLLGAFLHTYEEVSPYPLYFFIGYNVFATLGYYNLPFLIMSEIIPLQVRGLASGIITSLVSVLIFGVNQAYPYMRGQLGFKNTIVVYGGISLIGAVILFFILPETKDLTLQEIEEYYNSRRATLVSQRRVMSMQLVQSKSLLMLEEKQKEREHKERRRHEREERKGKKSSSHIKLDARNSTSKGSITFKEDK